MSRVDRISRRDRLPLWTCIVVIGSTIFSQTSAHAQFDFTAAFHSIDSPPQPRAVAIADLDEDGIPDLVTAHEGKISTQLGLGDGAFGPQSDTESNGSPRSIVVGDLNRDSHLDVVVGKAGAEGSITIHYGDGDGGFLSRVEVLPAPWTNAVTIGDLNGDHRLDIAVAAGQLLVFIATSDGHFEPRRNFDTARNSATAVAIGQVVGDWSPDILVAGAGLSSGSVAVHENIGGLTFRNWTAFETGTDPVAMLVQDLDGDQRLDVVTANVGSQDASVRLGTGAGGFGPRRDYPIGAAIGHAALADADADGGLDLLVCHAVSYDPFHGFVAVLRGASDGTFLPKVDYECGPLPQWIAVGDVGNDGHQDVVVAIQNTPYPGTLSVLAGNGDGSFGQAKQLALGGMPSGMQCGDLNSDGRLDLVACGYPDSWAFLGDGFGNFGSRIALGVEASDVGLADLDGDDHVDIVLGTAMGVTSLLGHGDGSFHPGGNHEIAAGVQSLRIADLNHDGNPDVATTNYGRVTVLHGQGDGSFIALPSFAAGPLPTAIAIGDIDSDGDLDLAVTSGQHSCECPVESARVLIFPGNPSGTFGSSMVAATTPAFGCELADLNGDGRLDLVVSSWTLLVLLGNGDGTFADPISHGDRRFATWNASPAIADLDGDGTLDVAACTEAGNTVAILRGHGNGSLSPGRMFGTGSQPSAVCLGDANGDRRPDLMVANYGSETISVLINRGRAVPVTVEDFMTASTESGVRLTWRLSTDTEQPLTGVQVERSSTEVGPFETRGPWLFPETNMSYEDDPIEVGEVAWYRLALRHATGVRTLAGPWLVQSSHEKLWKIALFAPSLSARGMVELRYAVGPTATPVHLAVHRPDGRLLRSLDRSVRAPGMHHCTWDGRDANGVQVARGVYFVQLSTAATSHSRKVVLIGR